MNEMHLIEILNSKGFRDNRHLPAEKLHSPRRPRAPSQPTI
jgi:hypothetical protein